MNEAISFDQYRSANDTKPLELRVTMSIFVFILDDKVIGAQERFVLF